MTDRRIPSSHDEPWRQEHERAVADVSAHVDLDTGLAEIFGSPQPSYVDSGHSAYRRGRVSLPLQEMARQWTSALRRITHAGRTHDQVEQVLMGCIGELVDMFRAENFNADPGEEIGKRMVELGFTDPICVRLTIDLLGTSLAGLPEFSDADGVPGKVISVLGAVAAGFGAGLRSMPLPTPAVVERAPTSTKENVAVQLRPSGTAPGRSRLSGRWFPITGCADVPKAVREEGAFLPWPLPSRVLLRAETYRALAAAEQALGRLDEAATRLPDRTALVRANQLREVQSSAGMDGVFAPFKEVLLLDLPEVATEYAVNEGLVRYLHASDEAVSGVRSGRPIDLALLGRISATVAGLSGSGSDAQPWRDEPCWLGGREPRDAYLIAAPPGTDLRTATMQWESWVGSEPELPALAKVALGHYQLAVLAPFAGAEHLARVYIGLELIRSGILHDQILPVSGWLTRHGNEYRERLRAVVNTGDLDGWITFIADGIQALSRQQLRLITELERLRESLLDRLDDSYSILRAANGIISSPVTNQRQIVERCGITAGDAHVLTQKLIRAGVVTSIDDKRNTQIIVCPDVVELLSATSA